MSASLTVGSRVGRWTLEEALGTGSFGSAWRAVDDQGRVAALKVLGGPPGGEVEALARVCHPAVPAVIDAAGDPVPFVVMSLARGRTLTRMIRAGCAPEAAAISVCGVLADALSVLHHAALPHGDLKPDNVVVGSVKRGEVMLVDFGLAGAEAGGTIQYAAPERLRGAPPSAAADVYALGLVLWEMLEGELPYAELGVSGSLMRRRSEVPDLTGHSPWLADLLRRMLAPDPAHRPDANVVTDILAARGATLPQITPELVRSRARTVHVPVPAVDDRVTRWLDEGGALQICGLAHHGRSHTIGRAVTALQARGAAWLRLSSSPQTWGAITHALADPALPGAPQPLPLRPHILDRAEAAAAALEERSPSGLFVLVDDLDTLDSGSTATLEVLVRRGHVAVCASGTEPVAWLPERVTLRPLEREGVQHLVCSVLGEQRPLDALVDRAFAVSGGVPGLVVDFLAAACRDGAIVRRAQRWLVDEHALSAIDLGAEVATAAPHAPGSLQARLGGLVAAAGAPLATSRLEGLLDAPHLEVEEALHDLLEGGYVAVEHEQVRCASQAARSILRRGCDELPGFHRRLAADLQAAGDPPAGQLAWHIVGAGDASAAAELGADLLRAVTLLDGTEGGRLSDALWALAPVAALAAPRVEALRNAGRLDEAIAFGQEQVGAGARGLPLLIALARTHLSRADGTADALSCAAEARALLDGAPVPLSLLLIQAKAHFRSDDLDAAIAASRAVPEPGAGASVEDVDDWLALQVVHGQSLHRKGETAAAVAALEAVPAAIGAGRPARALLEGGLGRLLYHVGRFIEAAEVMARAAADDAGLPALDRARMLNNAGLVFYQSGRRLQALARWEDALLLFERLGAEVDQIRVSVNLCVGYRQAGRWERSRQSGVWATEAAAARGLADLQAMAAGNLGDLFLDQGRYTDAERWYLSASRVARENAIEGELLELARRNAELAVLRDDADALTRADEAQQMADEAGETLESARCRGLRAVCLARRHGDEATIVGLIETAERDLREAGAAGELAHLRLLAAEAWVALDRPRRAISTCDKVIAFAEEMGEVGLRTRADQILAQARAAEVASATDHRLDLLVSLAVAVARSQDDESHLLDTIAASALELLRGERAFVLLVDRDAPEGTRVAARRYADGAPEGEPSSSVVRRVLEARTEIIAADLSERGDLRSAASVVALSLRSAMCVPMLEGDELLGVIYVDSGSVNEGELSNSARYMRALASHAAVAVANSRRIQAIRDRAAWAAEVAHDMRSPVSSILTVAETVLEDPRDVSLVTECMEDVVLAGRRSLEMAERFLTDGSSTPELLSTRDIIDDTCRTLAPQARSRGLLLEWSGGDGLAVSGDRVELGRVLLNLVSNAIKYSDPGGRITVTSEAVKGGVRIQVRDRGPGVPQEALGRIFARGVQAPGAREGHGIGLSVVQRLVEDHGGSITVSNHPDGGALFTVVLPISGNPPRVAC